VFERSTREAFSVVQFHIEVWVIGDRVPGDSSAVPNLKPHQVEDFPSQAHLFLQCIDGHLAYLLASNSNVVVDLQQTQCSVAVIKALLYARSPSRKVILPQNSTNLFEKVKILRVKKRAID
jgi:hypothetical protein